MKKKKIEKLDLQTFRRPLDPGLIDDIEEIENKINEIIDSLNSMNEKEQP